MNTSTNRNPKKSSSSKPHIVIAEYSTSALDRIVDEIYFLRNGDKREGEFTITELVDKYMEKYGDISRSTVHRKIAKMKDSGVLKTRESGANMFYFYESTAD